MVMSNLFINNAHKRASAAIIKQKETIEVIGHETIENRYSKGILPQLLPVSETTQRKSNLSMISNDARSSSKNPNENGSNLS